MSIAGPHDGHGAALLSGARSRHTRTLVIAALLLILIWGLKKAPVFHAHYESGFRLVNPSKEPAAPAPPQATGPEAIALPGDSFYLTDALHQALHPPPPPPPEPPAFPDNVAVIMETDPSRVPNLVPLMLHFANVLGPKWPVVLVTAKPNWVEPASPAFRRLMREQRIRIYFLPEDSTSFPDHNSVSAFLTRPWFWEQFEGAGRVLTFQADSVLCSRSAAAVDDFAEWDLVGAPIAQAHGAGFNGGLSLRNPRLLLTVVRDPARNDFAARLGAHMARLDAVRAAEGEEAAARANLRIPPHERFEDQWFYAKLRDVPEARLPGLDVARRFAVETVWEERPLGYHQPFRWLTAAQKAKVLDWCPEAAMLEGGSHFFGGGADKEEEEKKKQ